MINYLYFELMSLVNINSNNQIYKDNFGIQNFTLKELITYLSAQGYDCICLSNFMLLEMS